MRRGEIWWASLPEPSGSGPGLRRPVLIIQANAFNESRIGTVIVAAITTNLVLADSPGNVRLSPQESTLNKPSVVNVSQLVTIDKRLLTSKVFGLRPDVLYRVDQGLRRVLSLPEGQAGVMEAAAEYVSGGRTKPSQQRKGRK